MEAACDAIETRFSSSFLPSDIWILIARIQE
jgi:hypothetical protein